MAGMLQGAVWAATWALAATAGVPPAPAAPVAAGCLLRAGDGVVMVQDVWSQRWSFPGGGRHDGESGAAAAERETYEETGLVVVAGRELLRTSRDFAVYACALRAGHVPVRGRDLALPDAARQEVMRAQVWAPAALPPAAWRFPAQRAPLSALAASDGPQASTLPPPASLAPLPLPAHPLLQAELRITRALQAVPLPGWDSLMRAASWLGQTGALALLLTVLWAVWPRRLAAEVGLVVLATCLFGCLLKQACALPRPCYLDPALQRAAADGFGFPSGHTTGIATAAGMLLRHATRRRDWVLAAVAVALCGTARVYLGVHFVHDVIGAIALATVAVMAHRAALRRVAALVLPWRAWAAGGGTLAALTIAVQPQPVPIILTSLMLGLGCGTALCPPAAGAPPPWRRQLPVCATAAVLAALATACVRTTDGAFLPCLGATVLRNLLLGLALPLAQRLHDAMQRVRVLR